MAYSFKPKQVPSSFAADVFDKFLSDVAAKVGLTKPKAANIVPWKRYVGSEKEWDGAEAGGMRDVLNANSYALDNLKDDHDGLAARVSAIDARLRVVEETPAARPFP